MCGADNSDLLVVMKLCLQTDTEDEIALFNRNTIARYENIAEYCAPLLAQASFKELNDFLSVCCPDLEKRNEFKQRLLRSNYVGENSILTSNVIGKNKLLNEFINDAFQDSADLGVEFRNQFASSPVTQNCLFKRIPLALEDLDPLMEFVDSFFSDEQIVVPLKKRLFFERFKEHRLINGDFFHTDSDDVIRRFVIWLLGSEDEVAKFKQSISVEDIFRNMVPQVPAQLRFPSGEVDNDDYKPEFPEKVDNFLMWYFNKDEEEIDKFIKLFSDEMAAFAPRKRMKMGQAWSNNSSNQDSCFFSSFNN
ncbi:uncharacterized protein LOC135835370 [Planococcus citri]|uniref:uncharacterized protein LOC135835370 n=1 Tax=Planococcus citri TaxID=170843 RepID=UPI0031F870B7